MQAILNSVQAGDYEAIKNFLATGGDVNTKNSFNENLLYLASQKGHARLVQLLLQHHANVHQVNTGKQNALFAAVSGGYLEVVQQLIAAGLDPQQRQGSRAGMLPIFMAFKYGHLDVIRYFFQQHLFKRQDLSEAIRYLRSNQAFDMRTLLDLLLNQYPDLTSEEITNLFGWLISIKNIPGLDYLLQKFPQIKNTYSSYFSVLTEESYSDSDKNDEDSEYYFKQLGLTHPVFIKRKYAFTYPVLKNPSLQFLLQHGLRFDLLDDEGQTILHKVVSYIHNEYDDIAAVNCVMDLGYPVNLLNARHQTPLMTAIEKGLFYHALALLARNPDLSIKDLEGRTAIAYARQFCMEGFEPEDDENIEYKEELLEILQSK